LGAVIKAVVRGVFAPLWQTNIGVGAQADEARSALKASNYWLQKVLAFGVHLPKPVATMLAMTRQT